MYYAIINGESHSMERLHYIKRQSNGLVVSCEKKEAQGITVDGENYALQGHDIGLPVIHYFWNADMERMAKENEELKAGYEEVTTYLLEKEFNELTEGLE